MPWSWKETPGGPGRSLSADGAAQCEQMMPYPFETKEEDFKARPDYSPEPQSQAAWYYRGTVPHFQVLSWGKKENGVSHSCPGFTQSVLSLLLTGMWKCTCWCYSDVGEKSHHGVLQGNIPLTSVHLSQPFPPNGTFSFTFKYNFLSVKHRRGLFYFKSFLILTESSWDLCRIIWACFP